MKKWTDPPEKREFPKKKDSPRKRDSPYKRSPLVSKLGTSIENLHEARQLESFIIDDEKDAIENIFPEEHIL